MRRISRSASLSARSAAPADDRREYEHRQIEPEHAGRDRNQLVGNRREPGREHDPKVVFVVQVADLIVFGMRESRNDAEEKIGYRGEFARRGLPEKIADRIAGDRSEQRSDRADRRIAGKPWPRSRGTGRSAARRGGIGKKLDSAKASRNSAKAPQRLSDQPSIQL